MKFPRNELNNYKIIIQIVKKINYKIKQILFQHSKFKMY